MTSKINEQSPERSGFLQSSQFLQANSPVTELLFSGLMPPNSFEQSEQISTQEVKQQLSFDFLTSPAQIQESLSIGSQPALEPLFEPVVLADLDVEDFALLDKCRKMGWWTPTVKEFADQILNNVYDLWQLTSFPGTTCFLLTTFEIFPSGEKWLSINYIVGRNCKPAVDHIHEAAFNLADKLGCTEIVGQIREERFFRFMKGRATRLSTLYKLERT